MSGVGLHPQLQHMPIPPHFLQASNYSFQPMSPMSHPFHPSFAQHHASSPPTSASMPLPIPFSPSMMGAFPMTPLSYPQQTEGSNVTSPTHPLHFINVPGSQYSDPTVAGDDEEDEYISPLAEAILKRPETMRSPSRSSAPAHRGPGRVRALCGPVAPSPIGACPRARTLCRSKRTLTTV